jgi:hypothetical protein
MLLDFANPDGSSARDILAERLYVARAPDVPTAWPYGVMRLETSNDGSYNGMRLTGTLEVLLFGRPWAQMEQIDAVADLFDRCAVARILNTDGLVFAHGFQRATLPGSSYQTIDAEVVTVRLSYTLAIWPTYLTNLTRVLTS